MTRQYSNCSGQPLMEVYDDTAGEWAPIVPAPENRTDIGEIVWGAEAERKPIEVRGELQNVQKS